MHYWCLICLLGIIQTIEDVCKATFKIVWKQILLELTHPQISLDSSLSTWAAAGPPCSQTLQYTHNQANAYQKSIDLTSYDSYDEIRILADIYTFNTNSLILVQFGGQIQRVNQHFDGLRSYCTTIAPNVIGDAITKINLSFKITSKPTAPQLVRFGYDANPTGMLSVRNVGIYLKTCSSNNCLICEQEICLTCKQGYVLQSNQCRCFPPTPYSKDDLCASSCSDGQYPDEYGRCKPHLGKTLLLSKFTDLVIINQSFTVLSDLQHSIETKSKTQIGSIDAIGPFQFNEGFELPFTAPGQTLLVSGALYFLGHVNITSQVRIYFDTKLISIISYFPTNLVMLPGLQLLEFQTCSQPSFKKCQFTRFSITINSGSIQSKIRFQGSFNVSDPAQAWAFRDLRVEGISLPPPSVTPLPITCSGGTPYLHNNQCVPTCPSYSTPAGTSCQDFGSIYAYPLYIVQAFHSPDKFQDLESVMGHLADLYKPPVSLTYIPQKNKNAFGGPNVWRNSQFIKIFTSLQPHYKVKFMIKVLFIDSDTPTLGNLTVSLDERFYSSTLLPGATGTNYIGLDNPDMESELSVELYHTSSNITIGLYCVTTGNCAIYDYFIIIARCPAFCQACTSDSNCIQPSNLISPSCPYGSYLEIQTLKCKSCQPGCLNCLEPNTCQNCFPGFEFYGNKCYCLDSQANVEWQYCDKTQCHQSCDTCSGQTSTTCLSCSLEKNRWPSLNSCGCINGFYLGDDKICYPCHPTCRTCNEAKHCLSCDMTQNRVLQFYQCECLEGYFQIESSYTCQKCEDSCKTCFLQTYSCTSCAPEHFRRLLNNRCYCNQGYYDDGTLICKACPNTCKTCLSFNLCIECYNEQMRILTNISKKCICAVSHYEVEGQLICKPCHKSCAYCSSSPEINKCTQCISNREPASQGSQEFLCRCKKGYYEIDSESGLCLDCLGLRDPPLDHYCYSKCGDQVVQWNEDCDDGNEFARDGCDNCKFSDSPCLNSLCLDCRIDTCTECQSGYFLDGGNTCKPCSAICTTCENKADRCTECSVKSKDGKTCNNCLPEFGFEIRQGQCVGICGDGIKTSGEQCDDGNRQNGDGCNENCEVESGSVCEQTCEPLIPVEVVLSSQSSSLYSPERIIIAETLDQISMIREISGTIQVSILNFTSFSYQIVDQSVQASQFYKLRLQLNLILLESTNEPNVTVYFSEPNLLINRFGQSLKEPASSIVLQTYIKKDQQVLETTNNLIQFSQYILYVMLGFACLAFLFGGMHIFWNFLDLLQIICYIKYFNVNFPYNVSYYLTLFGFAEFDFIKQFLNLEALVSQYVDTPDADPKFKEEGYSSVFLVNSVGVVTVLIIALLTYLFCYICFKAISNLGKYLATQRLDIEDDDNLLYYFCMRIVKNLELYFFNITLEFSSGMIRALMATSSDLNLALCLQIKDFNKESKILFASGIITLIIFLVEIILIYKGFQTLCQAYYVFQNPASQNQYGALYEGLKQTRIDFRRIFNLIYIVKKVFFMAFLVFLYDYPVFQVLLVSALNMITVAILVYAKPLEDQSEFVKSLIGELMIWVIEVIVLVYAFNDQSRALSVDQEIALGWGILSICCLLIVTQLFIDVKQHGEYLFNHYRVLKKLLKTLRNLFSNQIYTSEQNFFLRKHIPNKKSRESPSNIRLKKAVTFSLNTQY